MKKRGHIFIIGRIGNLYDLATNKIIERGVELVDVVTAIRSLGDVDEIQANILTPGGTVQVSDDIFAYLVSLKSNKKIITRAYPDPKTGRGLIASAGVKIFLAGDERLMRKTDDDLFIHFPRMNPGTSDADRLQKAAEVTAQMQKKMVDDYAYITGNTAEALTPIMKKETSLPGEDAVKLGFATSLVDEPISIQAILNNHTMDFKQIANDLINQLKALVVGEGAPVEYELASGKKLVTNATDPTKVVGATATIDGQPAPDGDHVDKEGNTVVVKEGKVAEVKPKAAAAPPAGGAPPAATASVEDRIKAMEEAQTNFMKSVLEKLQAVTAMKVSPGLTKKDLDDFATSIRAEIKTGHRVPEVKPDDVQALAKEWDDSMKNNTNSKIKKENNAKWQQMYFAKYKTAPANP